MAKGRILLVEDEIYILHILDFSFEMEGYEVMKALNGEDALSQVKKSRPDLIVMEAIMPLMGGLDACRALKASDETKDIPIVILSPRARDVDRQMAFEAGAEDFVTRPFSPRKLIDRVNAILVARRSATG